MATVYEIQTEKILNKFEEAKREGKNFRWVQPWVGGVRVARSYATGKPYKGINRINLDLGEYITFNQVKELQKKNSEIEIKKGCHMLPVFFASKATLIDEEDGTEDEIFFTRFYKVFNIKDIKGIEPKFKEVHFTHTPTENTELLEAYINAFYNREGAPKINYVYGSEKAYFTPATNSVTVPTKDTFKSLYEYYGTVLHETTHSTGVPLKRKIQNSFGNEEYSYEELVAEIGSSMALSIFGIVDDLPDNNLAYIQGWVKKLQDQPKMITMASSQAQKAVDYFITTAEKYLNLKDEEKISTLINQ